MKRSNTNYNIRIIYQRKLAIELVNASAEEDVEETDIKLTADKTATEVLEDHNTRRTKKPIASLTVLTKEVEELIE